MDTRLLMTTAMVAALLTAGCAQGNPESPVTTSPTPSGGASPSAQPPIIPSTVPATPGKDEVTITGTVEIVGIEGGCKVLRGSANKAYELKGGDPSILKAGAQVTVRGKIRPDIMTICQMGPVLEVISSQPA